MFKKKTLITCDVDDINNLVSEKLAPLTNNPERYKNFECVAEFEWNSAQYQCNVDLSDVTDSIYLKYDKGDIMKGSTSFGIHQIMTFLLEHGLIEEGEYLIDASW